MPSRSYGVTMQSCPFQLDEHPPPVPPRPPSTFDRQVSAPPKPTATPTPDADTKRIDEEEEDISYDHTNSR